MYTEEDSELFVLPYSPLLEGAAAERWDDDELWFMPMAEARRPGPQHAPCRKCRGALYIEIEIPGVGDLRCLACGETNGEVLHSDLRAQLGPDGMVYIATHAESLLWARA